MNHQMDRERQAKGKFVQIKETKEVKLRKPWYKLVGKIKEYLSHHHAIKLDIHLPSIIKSPKDFEIRE